METNTRDKITAPVLAYFDEVAEYAEWVDTYENEYGSIFTRLCFAADAPEGYELVTVRLNPSDEDVLITGHAVNGLIHFEVRVGMSAPLDVIRSAFEAAVGLDA